MSNALEKPLAGKRILVVEDEAVLSDAIKSSLEIRGFAVTCAADGQAARNVLGLQSFDLVISDIRMPHMSGLELLRHICAQKGPPVILMTGFSEIAEAKDAYDLGAKGFLAKPFKQVDLVSAVETALAFSTSPETASTDDFVPLRIEEFVTGKEIQYDIFIRLKGQRFVKVAHGGESISMDRVAQYRAKGLGHLYLRKEDFASYLGFTYDLAKKVVSSDKIEWKKKVDFLTQTTSQIVNGLYLEGADKGRFDMAAQLVTNLIAVSDRQPETLEIFYSLQSHSETLYAHSLAVGLYSAMIGRELGWQSPRTISRLALSGLLHDVGKKELPKELLEKPRHALNAEEIQLIESHTVRGRKILEQIPNLPEEVPVVAIQHHENCRSQGYPLRLSKARIAPFARIVAVANEFCHWAFPLPGQTGLEPGLATSRMQESSAGLLDEEFLRALTRLFNRAAESGKAAG